jgi:phage terminase large subunit
LEVRVFQLTTATKKLLNLTKDIRLVAGGTSASKTIGILQVLIDIAQSSTIEDCEGLPIDVVSETMPHMRGGAMQDFENIMRSHGYWVEDRWNKTFSTYTFETGIKMRFFSADTPSKVHGPRRWILYINEGNNIAWPIADHLMVRTKWLVFVDWNPASEFWAYEEIINNPEYAGEFDFITLTYKDNEALDPVVVKRIEAHKNNKMWWQVYGLGQLGEIEGRIYTGWQWIDEIPHEARLVKRGLDFGYKNDPSGLIAIYEYNGGFILDEEMYQYGMSNREIADHIKSLSSQITVVADSSEPKSIDEIRSYGVNILPAVKGSGSKNAGIQFVQDQRISATKRSINLKKEYERYIWLKDKLTDKFTNDPPDVDDHLLDPLRYGLESFMKKTRSGRVVKTAPSLPHGPTTVVTPEGRLMLNLDYRRAYAKRRTLR